MTIIGTARAPYPRRVVFFLTEKAIRTIFEELDLMVRGLVNKDEVDVSSRTSAAA